ncbi:hypothetical protein [Pseudoclavibacter endophyticus]|uniref:Uncharacterized protein n=1 Tax=Pseudoclavibacter endophyticus TaxID=1778590 RepID=A0A6H9WNA1_9MICO|nr:hypothetical protein [Pseudoclavibacter endophyticus]KAB1648106.1 hypothetical protein F8O04_10300 [Pseudoclavibacter endophyticus]
MATDDDWLGLLPDEELPGTEREASAPRKARPAAPSVAEPEPGARSGAEAAAEDAAVHRSRGRTALLAGAVAVVVVLVFVGAAFGPQIARNLSTSVAEVDTAVTLTAAEDAVTVTAPQGWHVVRPLGSSSEVALETPDGLVEIALTLTHRSGGGPPPGQADAAGGLEWRTEHPAETLTAIYAHVDQPADVSAQRPAGGGVLGMNLFADGSPAHTGIVATIAHEPPAASGAVVDVRVTSDVPIGPYLGEFADIVERMEFAS